MQRPQPGGRGRLRPEDGWGVTQNRASAAQARASSIPLLPSRPPQLGRPDAGAVASASSVMFPSLTDRIACCHLTHLDSHNRTLTALPYGISCLHTCLSSLCGSKPVLSKISGVGWSSPPQDPHPCSNSVWTDCSQIQWGWVAVEIITH